MEWLDPPVETSLPCFPGMHPLVGRALAQRGCRTPVDAQAFLDHHSYSPTASTDLPGLSEAVDRIVQAIHHGKTICVWGDFDVDGQTSTTILVQPLQDLGADVLYHIPVRETEGHGVHLPELTQMIDRGTRLLLTCDTGISAHTAVEFARQRGVEVIITDHHDLPESLPPAEAIVNPKTLPVKHPLYSLSGSGVAYKVAEELYARFNKGPAAEELMDLACLGLVADLSRLVGDARYLVQRGIESLRASTRLGLLAVFDYAKLIPGHLTEEHISFEIAPRLNALGRLGDANPAVELFTTINPARARVLANILEGLNIQRQLLCSQVTQAAEAQLRERPSLLDEPVLVLAGPNWPAGVVGIVASHLVERYHRPAILFSVPTDASGFARGSARSVEGLNITAAIAEQSDLLRNFGGHPMAAGLALEAGKLPEFRVRLARTVERMAGKRTTPDRLQVDAWLDLDDISMELADALETLAPYGPGNEALLLATRDLKVQDSARIGRNQEHLKLGLSDAMGHSQSVLWWNGAEEVLPEGLFDLAYRVRASDWKGSPQLQMEWVDYRQKEAETIQMESSRIEVLDHRREQDPVKSLVEIRAQGSTEVWAEGPDKEKVDGKDRNCLSPADQLVIWTTPASPETFSLAVEKVCPKKIFLFAVAELSPSAEVFLAKLAGYLKYALSQKEGRTTLAELAAALAQTTSTVRYGLEWLAARGEICVQLSLEGGVTITRGNTMKDPEKVRQLFQDLKSLLAESAAYQAHFRDADKDCLIPKSQA